jgi:prevent-host-death family protein
MYILSVHGGSIVAKRYSVADARKHLPELLDQVEGGRTVEITRRGEPVAVVLPVAEYNRTHGGAAPFERVLAAWRRRFSDEDRDLPDGFFEELREGSTARDVDL